MLHASVDTIVAVSTAPGRGAIGIVRISGPLVPHIAARICGSVPAPRRAFQCRFAFDETIDSGLALYFRGPASFTGEDVLELQAHGNPVVLADLVAACVRLGARPARPGEFTERSFLNGKLDLAQAEAVADLIDAGSSVAARAAVRSLSGAFSKRVEEFCSRLRELRTLVEASLDFPEEGLDVLGQYDIPGRLGHALRALEDIRNVARQGVLLKEGARIVIVGEPNVGKSSLLNALADEDLAIVTDIPGTTRDTIRAETSIEGVPIHVIDTAGLRLTDDLVEQAGIERGRAASLGADLALVVVDARTPVVDAVDRVKKHAALPLLQLIVRNKCDLAGDALADGVAAPDTEILVSAVTGYGIAELRHAILRFIGWGESGESEGVFIARERHLAAMERARSHIEAAIVLLQGDESLLAEELRYAESSLEVIFGRTSPDDLLGEIFSRFCIGK